MLQKMLNNSKICTAVIISLLQLRDEEVVSLLKKVLFTFDAFLMQLKEEMIFDTHEEKMIQELKFEERLLKEFTAIHPIAYKNKEFEVYKSFIQKYTTNLNCNNYL